MAKKSKTASKKKSPFARLVSRLVKLGLLGFALIFGGVIASFIILARDLPELKSLADYTPTQATYLLDVKGRTTARFAEERRTVINVEQLPAHIKEAFLAAEDANFYDHEGLDYTAIVAAVLNELKVKVFGGSRRGGSTITQQTAKTFLLTNERTYSRKLKEMILAKRIEDEFTKDEILHLYLNQIYFGNGAYGIEEAARTYYGKKAQALTVNQAAVLASAPKWPNRINPFADVARVDDRRKYVLGQMVRHKFITEKQKVAALQEAIRVDVKSNPYLNRSPYYAEHVRLMLPELIGADAVAAGGLKVYTSIDAEMQAAAQRAVRVGLAEVDKRQGYRGPLLRLDPDDARGFGEVLEALRVRLFADGPAHVQEKLNALAGRPVWDLKRLAPVLKSDTADLAAPPHQPKGDKKATTRKPKASAAGGKLAKAQPSDSDDDEDEGAGAPRDDEAEAAATAKPKASPSVVRLARHVARRELVEDQIVGAVVKKVDAVAQKVVVDLGTIDGVFSKKSIRWARPYNPTKLTKAPRSVADLFKVGDLILVRVERINGAAKDKAGKALAPWVDVALEQTPLVQGAFVAIDPQTHRVKALVGGYDFTESKFNRATQAFRQPGSSFKPFIYATGIEQKQFTAVGFLDGDASRMITDAPKVYFDRWTGKKWNPKNSGGKYRGDITLRTCLTFSINTCSISILEKVGVDEVHALAERVGLKTDKKPFPKNLTLALGTGEVRPLDLVNAYTVFPNGGEFAPPVFIEKVKDAEGKVLYEAKPVEPVRVMEPGAAYIMSDLMKSVVQNGTAKRAKMLGKNVAGKTGTTNMARSVWFVGFSPGLVGGAYVGFDNNDPMGHREYGGKAALPIWLRFMSSALSGAPDADFEMPDDIEQVRLDSKSGLLARSDQEEAPSSGSVVNDLVDRVTDALLGASDSDEDVPETLPPAEEGELPEGVYEEVFLRGTAPKLTAEESAPPPLELMDIGGGLAP